jgi:hypothetical protein
MQSQNRKVTPNYEYVSIFTCLQSTEFLKFWNIIRLDYYNSVLREFNAFNPNEDTPLIPELSFRTRC